MLGHVRRILIRYFDGCPHWRIADERVRAALGQSRLDATIGYETVETIDDAIGTGFRGSPTILIDGIDPFPTGDAPPALACRIYPTPAGPQGAPTVEELIAALSSQQ
jgi:hypothetical protein